MPPPGMNLTGILLCVIAFGITLALTTAVGEWQTGPLTAIFGALVAALDALYRLCQGNSGLWAPQKGGTCLFQPLWFFGLFWLGLGILYTCLRWD
jgi:hypothetical protein